MEEEYQYWEEDEESASPSSCFETLGNNSLMAIALLKTDSKIRFQHAFNFS